MFNKLGAGDVFISGNIEAGSSENGQGGDAIIEGGLGKNGNPGGNVIISSGTYRAGNGGPGGKGGNLIIKGGDAE